jgi:hypothetical protein
MFWGFSNVTFEHLDALGDVLQNFSMNFSTNLQHFKARVVWFFFLFQVKQGNSTK